MKGQAFVYGSVIAMILTTALIFITVLETSKISRDIDTREGLLISFADFNHLLLKTLNQSIPFISQRAAYDIGKVGGIEGASLAIWSSTYPTLSDLEENYLLKVNKNLPSRDFGLNRRVDWEESTVDALFPPDCGVSLEESKCFMLSGEKRFTSYQEDIDTTERFIHKINTLIDSSYFKLLSVGRKIFDDPALFSLLGDANALKIELKSRYPGLDFVITPTGPAVASLSLQNPGFESDLTGWTLNNNPIEIIPSITITSPDPTVTYYKENVSLEFTVGLPFSTLSYTLDDMGPVAITGNTNVTVRAGTHAITVTARDSSGKTVAMGREFFKSCVGDYDRNGYVNDDDVQAVYNAQFSNDPNADMDDDSDVDSDDVIITFYTRNRVCSLLLGVISPENTTYNVDAVDLTFIVDGPSTDLTYSLNNEPNISISGNIVLPPLSNGAHNITMFGTDTDGNVTKSNTVFFSVRVKREVVNDTVVHSGTKSYQVDDYDSIGWLSRCQTVSVTSRNSYKAKAWINAAPRGQLWLTTDSLPGVGFGECADESPIATATAASWTQVEVTCVPETSNSLTVCVGSNDINTGTAFFDDVILEELLPSALDITIKDNTCLPDNYCLAPLKAGEVGEIAGYPYDYLKLRFTATARQTSFTSLPPADFSLELIPSSTSVYQGTSNTSWVKVKSLTANSAPVRLDASGVPVGLDVSFLPQTATPTFNSLMTITASSIPRGSYTLTITGVNSAGLIRTATLSLEVTGPNPPPVASFIFTPSNPKAGQPVSFDASASTDDRNIVSYAWDFGDGSTGSGVVTTYTYSSAGTYTITLTVTDDEGATDSETQTITVLPPNQPPTASLIVTPDTTPEVNEPRTFDTRGSFDSDGTIINYKLDFGDGTPLITSPTPIVADHSYFIDFTFVATLTVTDNEGATGTDSEVISVQSPPVPIQFTTVWSGNLQGSRKFETLTSDVGCPASHPYPVSCLVESLDGVRRWQRLVTDLTIVSDRCKAGYLQYNGLDSATPLDIFRIGTVCADKQPLVKRGSLESRTQGSNLEDYTSYTSSEFCNNGAGERLVSCITEIDTTQDKYRDDFVNEIYPRTECGDPSCTYNVEKCVVSTRDRDTSLLTIDSNYEHRRSVGVVCVTDAQLAGAAISTGSSAYYNIGVPRDEPPGCSDPGHSPYSFGGDATSTCSNIIACFTRSSDSDPQFYKEDAIVSLFPNFDNDNCIVEAIDTYCPVNRNSQHSRNVITKCV